MDTGIQTSGVLSIQIAKVQENVEWDNGGKFNIYGCSTNQLINSIQHCNQIRL